MYHNNMQYDCQISDLFKKRNLFEKPEITQHKYYLACQDMWLLWENWDHYHDSILFIDIILDIASEPKNMHYKDVQNTKKKPQLLTHKLD